MNTVILKYDRILSTTQAPVLVSLYQFWNSMIYEIAVHIFMVDYKFLPLKKSMTTLKVQSFAGTNFHERRSSKLSFAGINFRKWLGWQISRV